MKKILFDLFPVLMFFITLKITERIASAGEALTHIFNALGLHVLVKPHLAPVMFATIAVIIASLLQIAWTKLRHGKVDNTLIFSASLVTVLGAMTLYFQNDAFIKWKPTVLYWALAVVLIGAEVFWKKNFIKEMLEKHMPLPDKIWQKLNLSWSIFFISLGLLNLYVAFNYSIDTWASFKLFGTTAILFAFITVQTLMLNKYLPNEDKQ